MASQGVVALLAPGWPRLPPQKHFCQLFVGSSAEFAVTSYKKLAKSTWVAPPRLAPNAAARSYELVKFASRFSVKAAMPSFWSLEENREWKVRRSKSSPCDSVIS